MNSIKFLLLSLFALSALSFTPVTNFSLSQLEGTWYVTTVYSTVTNWSLTYCTTFTFKVINSTLLNVTTAFLSGSSAQFENETHPLYPDPNNPAIIYQESQHIQSPFVVGNISTVSSWQGNVDQMILALNYTYYHHSFMVFGLSRAYDVPLDVRPYTTLYNLPVQEGISFWGIYTACDARFKWVPIQPFSSSSLLGKKWNVIAVYDPTNTTLVPWYGQGIYPWNQAYCTYMTFQPAPLKQFIEMGISSNNIYFGNFKRSWYLLPNPKTSSVFYGFDMSSPTLLYVQYWDTLGNAILTTGTTTSFLISTSNKEISSDLLTLFQRVVNSFGLPFNENYLYKVNSLKC